MPYFVVLLVLLIAVSVIAHQYHLGSISVIAISLILGLLSYFLAGLGVAQCSGVGRFYSVPFGREKIADSDIVINAICGVGLWVIIVFGISKISGPLD